RDTGMEVQIALNGGQVNDAEAAQAADIVGALSRHDFGRSLDDAPDPVTSDEHMMTLFRQHKARRACERIESGLGERGELEFTVAVGKERKHEKRQPIGRWLVERTQNTGIVSIARAATEQSLRLLTTVTAKITMQQVNHRPKVAPLLYIHLE